MSFLIEPRGVIVKTVQLDFSEDFLRRLDAVALQRTGKPPTKFEWLQRDPEGRELWRQISVERKYDQLPDGEVSRLIDRRYRASTGGPKLGRPRLAQHRVEVLIEAFEATFGTRLVEKQA